MNLAQARPAAACDLNPDTPGTWPGDGHRWLVLAVEGVAVAEGGKVRPVISGAAARRIFALTGLDQVIPGKHMSDA